MTREEAIARVKHQRDWANEVNRMLDVEAFDMAIKALEQEPTTKNDLGVGCISRIETIDYLCKHCPDDGECFKDCDEIKHLRQMPSVTPQEPRKGHWIEHEESISTAFKHLRECSCCKCYFDWLMPRNSFCPNCGADMKEGEE